SPVFRRWLISYFIILLILISLMIFLNIFLSKDIHGRVSDAYQRRLENYGDVLDLNLSNIIHFSENLAMTKDLESLIFERGRYDADNSLTDIRVVNDFKLCRAVNSFISSVVFYSLEREVFYTAEGLFDFDSFYELSDFSRFFSFTELETFFSSMEFREFYFFEKNDDYLLLYSLPVPITSDSSASGRMFFLLNTESLLEFLNYGDMDDFFLIEAEHGEIFPRKKKPEVSRDYIVLSYKLNFTNLTLVSYISEYSFFNPLFLVRIFSFITIFTAIVIGLFLSLFFAVKNYGSLLAVSDKMRKNLLCENSSHDELKMIDSALDQHKEIIKVNILCFLLEGRRYRNLSYNQIAEYLGISDNVSFKIVGFKYFSDSSLDPLFLPEIESPGLSSFQFACGNHRVWIFFAEDSACFDSFDLSSLAKSYVSMVDKKFSLEMVASISHVGEGVVAIEKLWNEVQYLFDFQAVFGPGAVIMSDHVKNTLLGYVFPKDVEFSLAASVRAGNCQRVEELLLEIKSMNFGKESISPEWISGLICSIAYVFQNCASDLPIPISEFNVHVFKEADNILKRNSIDEVFEDLISLGKDIANLFEARKISRNSDLNSKIISLVNDNLFDLNFSMDIVADHFGMNKDYLLKFFKSQNGISFNEFVTKARLNGAVNYLEKTNHSIAEISVMCGFGSVVTFMRVFKKEFGITPGDFRKKTR
ncbi:MAG: helix-turn-helix transcriptional regulator, partial [Spirochaetales bacterium]|nr:helix-turn-helix transcriptional regulator [Spirochaetales bacterium]